MYTSYKTGRLKVTPFINKCPILGDEVRELLTDEVTKHLPPDWQGITTDWQAIDWLEQRLNECTVFTICTKLAENFIGFLFLYGEEDKNGSVRIGYVISNKFWGCGYASEVVGGLVELMKQADNASSIIAGVTKGHLGSIKVLTNNGFIHTESNHNTEFYGYKL